LKIVEIFDSIQGEGIQIGMPMTFIRLAGCNLRCTWCDTKYALQDGIEMDEDDIVEQVHQRWVCITGGEPLLQNLNKLAYGLKSHGYKIAIETNGTITPTKGVLMRLDLWTISPKNLDMDTRSIVDILHMAASYQFKFVIKHLGDISDWLNWVEGLNSVGNSIVFQPERYAHENDYFNFMNEMIEYVKKIKSQYTYHNSKFVSCDIRILPQLQWLIWKGRKGI